jgi:fatty-acyl-CoA synthase
VVIADARLHSLLEAVDLGDVRLLRSDDPSWRGAAADAGVGAPHAAAEPESLFMLIVTPGSSGDPKAVRITHQKVTYPGPT